MIISIIYIKYIIKPISVFTFFPYGSGGGGGVPTPAAPHPTPPLISEKSEY